MHLATRVAGTAAALTLSLGALAGPAVAGAPSDGPSKPEACAQQQKQLDKAEAALDRLTAVFAKQQTKVAKEKKEFKGADTAAERRAEKKDVAEAKQDRREAKQAKRAQQQRVAQAAERLEKCQAEPTEAPAEPTEG